MRACVRACVGVETDTTLAHMRNAKQTCNYQSSRIITEGIRKETTFNGNLPGGGGGGGGGGEGEGRGGGEGTRSQVPEDGRGGHGSRRHDGAGVTTTEDLH